MGRPQKRKGGVKMKKEKTYTLLRQDGTKIKKSYVDLCDELGFYASVNFVKIVRGKISFTLGKPNEILSLARRVGQCGYIAGFDSKDYI